MLGLKGEPSIFFKIEVKFKIKYLLPKDFVCVDWNYDKKLLIFNLIFKGFFVFFAKARINEEVAQASHQMKKFSLKDISPF